MARYGTEGSGASKPENSYRRSVNRSIRPILPGENVRREEKRRMQTADFNEAKAKLRDNEDAAGEGISEDGIGGSEAMSTRERERRIADGVNYTGAGRTAKVTTQVAGRVAPKGFLKKYGPVLTVVLAMFGGGVMAGVGQLSMPFSFVAQIQENFDSIKPVNEARSTVFLREQLDPDRVKDPVRTTMFTTKFKITSKQETMLAKQGITVDRDFDYNGKKITVMKFDDGSGFDDLVIVPNEKIASNIGEVGNGSRALSFSEAWSTIPDFRNGYKRGSLTWRGSVGAWFDNVTVKFLQSNNITRNLFQGFQEKVAAENEGNSKSAAQKLMQEHMGDGVEVGARNISNDVDDNLRLAFDDDGNPGKTQSSGTIEVPFTNVSRADIRTKLDALSVTFHAKSSGIANAAVNGTCAVFNFVGAVQLLLAAYEGAQILQVTSSYLEAIQKVQAGDGAESPMNDLMNALVTRADTLDEEGNPTGEAKTAMQANAMGAMYGNYAINQEDTSVKSFNFSSRLENIAGLIGTSMQSFMACSIAKVAAAAVDLAIDVATIVGCAASLGIGCLVEGALQAGTSIAVGAAVSVTLATVVGYLTPVVFRTFSQDLVGKLAGEDLGNALVAGANMYQGNNHRSGGGSLTNKAGLERFALAQQESIAEQAQYERETLSPFDVSSKYTFFGSLANQFATFSTSQNMTTGIYSTLSTLTSKAVTMLTPMAAAVTATEMVESTGNCPYLESIGAVGDAFCNPYIVSDTRTFDMDPQDVIDEIQDELEDASSDGEAPGVKSGSDLEKYIKYCDGRESPFGVNDQNIAADFMESSTGNTAVDAAAGAVPIFGDVMEIIDDSSQMANAAWISGEACVIGNKAGQMSGSEVPSWGKSQYYQRFVEDQRLAEDMGLVEKSAVTAYLDDYYAENPLDNSFEGVLARKSGLDKEAVVAILDLMEYEEFVAQYDPSERYVMGEDGVDDSAETLDFGDVVIARYETVPRLERVIYNDLRNKSLIA